MFNSVAVIFITGIIVFFILTFFLVCFTQSSIELPLSYSEFEDWPLDSEDSVATLPEDARFSYERAKSKERSYHLFSILNECFICSFSGKISTK